MSKTEVAEPLAGEASAHWKVTLEFTGDDREGAPDTTTISQTGTWTIDEGHRPVNECVAITMASVMQMLLESGQLIRESDFAGSAEAFGGN